MFQEVVFVVMGLAIAYAVYVAREREAENKRLVRERNYYYQLAVSYYNLALSKDSEASGLRKLNNELSRQIDFFKAQLAEARRERKDIERLLREVKKANKGITSLMKLVEAVSKLDDISRRLSAIETALRSSGRSTTSRSVRREASKELLEVKKLKEEIERAIERLVTVAEKVEKSSEEYSDFVSEVRGKTDEIIRRFEEELAYYGESFANAVTKMTSTVRSNPELYRNVSSDRGENFERFALPVLLVKNGRIIGKIRSEDIYHVGGYAPFDFLIVVPEYIEGEGVRKKKRVRQLIFAEMKTGYSGLSEYEYEFARKVISLKSDFLKYGIIRVVKETDKRGINYWGVRLEIIEDEKRLKEFVSQFEGD